MMRRGSGSDIFARNRLKFLDTWASARDRWPMRSVSFTITGMTCGGCVAAVRNVLSRQPGVSDVKVEIGKATLNYDEASVDEKALVAAIERAGFSAAA